GGHRGRGRHGRGPVRHARGPDAAVPAAPHRPRPRQRLGPVRGHARGCDRHRDLLHDRQPDAAGDAAVDRPAAPSPPGEQAPTVPIHRPVTTVAKPGSRCRGILRLLFLVAPEPPRIRASTIHPWTIPRSERAMFRNLARLLILAAVLAPHAASAATASVFTEEDILAAPLPWDTAPG